MNFSKKITPFFLAATLATSYFVPCKANISPKHKKHLAVGAYFALGSYSTKKTIQSLMGLLDAYIYREGLVLTIEAARCALYTFLTCFAAKNMIEEILKKEQPEKKQIHLPKKQNDPSRI